jgi:predicted amidohydrolase
MQDIKAALVQMNALVGKVDKNLQEHRKYVKRAAKLGVTSRLK